MVLKLCSLGSCFSIYLPLQIYILECLVVFICLHLLLSQCESLRHTEWGRWEGCGLQYHWLDRGSILLSYLFQEQNEPQVQAASIFSSFRPFSEPVVFWAVNFFRLCVVEKQAIKAGQSLEGETFWGQLSETWMCLLSSTFDYLKVTSVWTEPARPHSRICPFSLVRVFCAKIKHMPLGLFLYTMYLT